MRKKYETLRAKRNLINAEIKRIIIDYIKQNGDISINYEYEKVFFQLGCPYITLLTNVSVVDNELFFIIKWKPQSIFEPWQTKTLSFSEILNIDEVMDEIMDIIYPDNQESEMVTMLKKIKEFGNELSKIQIIESETPESNTAKMLKNTKEFGDWLSKIQIVTN